MRRDLPAGTVTFLFTDVEGSTKLLHELGAQAYTEKLAEHRRIVREACTARGGVEVDTQGDAFFVAFPTAADALEAARAVTEELASGPITLRIGLHTGTPLVTEEGYVGQDVHLAARVAASAHGSQIVLSQATRALLDERYSLVDLGEHRLKDIAEPVAIFQLGDGQFPPLKTISNTNLPRPASSFIGRERELSELLARIDDGGRLLTLTGPGGSGKTRLALEAAATLVPEYKAGVFWVGLASLRDPALVSETIAQTLGAKDGLAEHVGEREMLLLLDNLEQVIEAAPELSSLLQGCPNLTLLVTSRELLRVQGEVEYPVPPLAETEAVSLFCERAQTVANEEIGQLCRRLDNLPLAVELAAARAKALSPAQILERLSQRLDLLKGGRDADPRQQTLRATIEWSYDLLSDDEQELFRRLAVFSGGCTLEAAGEVCDGDLDTLQPLVEKSLLRFSNERYWMLEMIREYARDSLATTGATEKMRRQHAMYFLSLAERADFESRSHDQTRWFERLDADHANLLIAIDWAREASEADLMLRLATALWGFWLARGHITNGKSALEEAVLLAGKRPARALLGLCTLRLMTGTSADELMPDAQEALRACEALRDDFSLAQAWNLLGRLEGSQRGALRPAEYAWKQALSYADYGKYPAEKAESIWGLTLTAITGPLPAEEGIARCKEFFALATDNPEVRAFCQSARAVLEAMMGEFSISRQLLVEGTRGFEELGLNVWAANNAQLAFSIEMLVGDPKAASTALRKSYQSLAEMGERGFLSTIAALLAHALYAQGEYEESERFSRTSEDAAAADDVFSQLLWRSARAKVSARRGKFIDAEVMAREAVLIAEQTDLLNTQADVLLDLAEVLTLAGRLADARDLVEEAARRYERKGNLPSLKRARDQANELAFSRRPFVQ